MSDSLMMTSLGAAVVVVGVLMAQLLPRLSAIGAAFGGALAAYGYVGGPRPAPDLTAATRGLSGVKRGVARLVMGVPVTLAVAVGTDAKGRLRMVGAADVFGRTHRASGTLVATGRGDPAAYDVADFSGPSLLRSRLRAVAYDGSSVVVDGTRVPLE